MTKTNNDINPTEKSSSEEMVASPRYKTTPQSLEDEIFGSKNERESFIRKFDEINDGGDE